MVRNMCFALPSHSVKEIIEGSERLKKISYGGSVLKGVMNFDGELVSILDTPSILDMKEEGEEPIILICKEKEMDSVAGLTVSVIKGMEVIDRSGIKPTHGKEASYIHGFIREAADGDEGVVALIDLKKFLDHALTMTEKPDRLI